MENNEINITDAELEKLINNKKINARILSLIEIIDNMILNQFFISYNQFLKNVLDNEGELFTLALKEKSENFDKCVEFYEKFLSGYFNGSNVDKSDLHNGTIRHPFDMSGTDTFLRIFLSIENQSNGQFFKGHFLKNLKSKLLLNFSDVNAFLTNLIRIKQLRNYAEHNGKIDDREQKIKFYEKINEKTRENKEKYRRIAKTEFNLLKSLQSIFYFLPDIELSEFYQLIVAELDKELKENKEFKKNLFNIFNSIKKTNRNNTIAIMESLKKDEIDKLQNIKDTWKPNLIQKNLKLFEFIKLYNAIGDFNIGKIKNILNTFAEQNPNNKFKITKNSISKITLEELYKIFHFFTGLNEIIRSEFINVFENLRNYIKNMENTIELEKQKEELKQQEKAEKDKNKKIKIKKEIGKINKKIKIKSKLAELVRDDIAHSNLFFYLEKENKPYNEVFRIYLKEIIKFYNIKYNNKFFMKKVKDFSENETLKSKKVLFIKRISSFILKKDYMFLLVPKVSKDKKDNKSTRFEIQKLSISNENSNIKQAFKEIIKAKINRLLEEEKKDNPEYRIYREELRINNTTIHGITVMKYKNYYFLKNILINELNNVKIEDLKFQNLAKTNKSKKIKIK